MKTIIFTILLIKLSSSNICYSQNYQQQLTNRRIEFAIMDIVTGGVIGGIGSVVHKQKGTKWTKAFARGFIKGGAGGVFTYTGKYMTAMAKSEETLWTLWPSKIVHAAGASMIENASAGKGVLSNFSIDYGPVRLDISGRPQVRFQPMGLFGIGYSLIAKEKFDLKYSALTGTPYFTIDNKLALERGEFGVTMINSVGIDQKAMVPLIIGGNQIGFTLISKFQIISHEIIHTYQYREWLALSNIYMKNKNEKRFIYFDVPNYTLPYATQVITQAASGRGEYYFNIYENEAETLSNKYAAW